MSLGPSLPLAPCYHPRTGINKGQTSLPSSAHNKGSAWSCTASPHGPVWTRSLASTNRGKALAKVQNITISSHDTPPLFLPDHPQKPTRSAAQMPGEAFFPSVGPVTTDDLFDCRFNSRSKSLVAAAVPWAERGHAEG
jgi:hypothetical protein